MRDESAVSSVVGPVLMVGIVITVAVVGALVADRLGDSVQRSDPGEAEAVAQVRDGRHEVILLAGDPILLSDGTVIASLDGNQTNIPLSWWADHTADGTTWQVGEALCLVGSAPECYFASGERLEIAILGPGISLDLGLVSEDSSAKPPIVYQGRRPSFYIDDQGGVVVQCDSDIDLLMVGAEITYGENGPDIPVTAGLSTTGTAPFASLFGGAAIEAGWVHDMGIVTQGSILGVQGHASYHDFDETYTSFDDDPHVLVLKDGDPGPQYQPYGGQASIGGLLEPYVDDDGNIDILDSEAILLFEFNPDLQSSAADFQDLVALFQFQDAYCD